MPPANYTPAAARISGSALGVRARQDAADERNLRFSRSRHCGNPRVSFKASGTSHWTSRLRKRLPPGYYVLYARAIDNAGQQQVDFPTRARRTFRIRK